MAKWPWAAPGELEEEMWLGTREPVGPGLAAFLSVDIVPAKALTREDWDRAIKRMMETGRG